MTHRFSDENRKHSPAVRQRVVSFRPVSSLGEKPFPQLFLEPVVNVRKCDYQKERTYQQHTGRVDFAQTEVEKFGDVDRHDGIDERDDTPDSSHPSERQDHFHDSTIEVLDDFDRIS